MMNSETTMKWGKSSHSGTNECVEVGQLPDGSEVGVRDTKQHGRGPVLRFAPADWDSFEADVAAGRFNLP